MRAFLFILVLLFASCENTQFPKACFLMTLSDALPVQFWLNGEESYNQKVVDGAHRFCFCQPFECDDEIQIQFTHDEDLQYVLKLLDSDGDIIHVFDFTKSGDVYSLTFIPSNYSPDVCDTQVKFQIVQYGTFENTDFDDGLTGWEIIDVGTFGNISASSYNGDNAALFGFVLSLTGGAGSSSRNSDRLRQSLGQNSNGTKVIRYSFRSGASNTSLGIWGGGDFVVTFYKNGVSVAQETILTGLTANTSYSGTYTSTANNFDAVAFWFIDRFSYLGGNFDGVWDIYLLSARVEGLNQIVVAESDCVSIASEHKETILIEYSNHRNFADLDNLDVSPDPTYQLRIPATFFKERYVTARKSRELTSGRVRQGYFKIKTQRLLSIGKLPPYMREKVLLALGHQFVTIGDDDWVMEDEFNQIDSHRNDQTNQMRLWLTKNNSVKRNIL